MNIDELKKKLHAGVMEFSYKKKDGSIRTAKGTLNSDFIPEEHTPKGAGYASPAGVQKYYDLNSEGWRSFLVENLVED